MEKRKNKSKIKRKEMSNHTQFNMQSEICALIIVAMGLLMGMSLFSDAVGIFGKAFKEICLGLLGFMVYAIPFLITAYGVHYTIKRESFQCGYKYKLSFLLVALISAFIHIFYYDQSKEMELFENISYLYHEGISGNGGGVVGGLIAEPLVNIFGNWGSGILIMTGVLILTIIILQISIAKVLGAIYLYCKKGLTNFYCQFISSITAGHQEKGEDDINIVTNIEKEIVQESAMVQDFQAAATEPSINIYDHNGYENIDEENEQVIKPNKKKLTDKKKKNTEEIEREHIAPSNEHIDYTFPPVELLGNSQQTGNQKDSINDLRSNAKKLVETLKSFGVDAKVLQVSRGPSVTRYELQPSAGVKVSKIVNLADDIALNLAASGVRIEAPIPGKAAVGIEVPNRDIMAVYLREVVESAEFVQHSSKLAFALGKDIAGKSVVADIGKMPHLLIAGATGSGKSVCINTLITSILYKANPNEVKLVMVDPKVVELGIYNGIPHLLIPVVTDPRKAAGALNWAVQEMVNRYKLFADNNVRDLKGYNALLMEKGEGNILPQIIIIIDELADLMMVAPNDVEDSICRLAQMARAAGMHLVIATQRPSVDVITGVIKANIPSRISFAVSSQVDSRTILDMAGAEKLLGKGDMLFYPVGAAKPVRLQGAFVTDKEVESIVEHIKDYSGANYHEDIIEQIEQEKETQDADTGDNDELLPQAIELVVEGGQASVSMLQRRLKVGYARAARLVDQMEARGIVGGYEGSKPRQVLITRQQYHEMLMNSDD